MAEMDRSQDAEESAMGGERAICQLCYKKPSRYTCPRCNIGYCSCECYRCEAHASCSEDFYRGCFMDGLREMQADPTDKDKMTEMLQRLETEQPALDSDDDDEDEDGAEDLAERLEGINLDREPDKVWNCLSDKEKSEFQAMLKDGRLGNMLSLWQPWWTQKTSGLVEEIGAGAAQVTGTRVPGLVRDIADLGKLLKKSSPSETIQYSVVNVLYGYAYISRLHNGEHLDHALQSAQELPTVCESLGQGTFQSVGEALHSCLECVQHRDRELHVSREFAVAVLEDTRLLLEGATRSRPLQYAMAALSDLHVLFRNARKELDRNIKSSTDTKLTEQLKAQRQEMFRCHKKLEFFISWTHKFGLCLRSLVPQVEMELCSLSSDLAAHAADKNKLEKCWGGKQPPPKMAHFVEEITDR